MRKVVNPVAELEILSLIHSFINDESRKKHNIIDLKQLNIV